MTLAEFIDISDKELLQLKGFELTTSCIVQVKKTQTFLNQLQLNRWIYWIQQECIPVGCIPPACWSYPIVSWGGPCSIPLGCRPHWMQNPLDADPHRQTSFVEAHLPTWRQTPIPPWAEWRMLAKILPCPKFGNRFHSDLRTAFQGRDHWLIKGYSTPSQSNCLPFHSVLGKIDQNSRLVPPPLGLVPSCLGNFGFVTGSLSQVLQLS